MMKVGAEVVMFTIGNYCEVVNAYECGMEKYRNFVDQKDRAWSEAYGEALSIVLNKVCKILNIPAHELRRDNKYHARLMMKAAKEAEHFVAHSLRECGYLP